MIFKEILVRYGELSTKGRNKKDFISRLRDNVRYSFNDIAPLKIRAERDRMFIEVENKVWDKKKGDVPEDGNDHCIDAFKYMTWYLYYGGV